MIKHGMDVQKQAIDFLNPGQIPVMAVDQPLFAWAKYMQSKFPETREKDQLVLVDYIQRLHY